jgi:ribosome recycling factor
MSEEILVSVELKMDEAREKAAERFTAIRTGRASIDMLDGVQIECYDTTMAVNQVANVGVPEARMLEIRVWDPKVVPAVEKAVLKADLGINPSTDGSVVRLKIPPLNEERREEMVKKLHAMQEEGKIALRNIRREANEEAKSESKDKKLTEDERDKLLEQIQEMTDKEIGQLDKMVKAKEEENREI